MAARRQSQPSDGSVFVAIFAVLFIVGLVITYIWWFVGAAALVGMFFAGRAVARKVEKDRELNAEAEAELASEREFDLRRRTERQHRWMITGDSRAIYGPEGAPAVIPPLPEGDDEAAQCDSPIAQLTATSAELAELIKDKPQGWPHALFASILVQRSTPLAARLRDSELGFTPSATTRIDSAWTLGRRVVGLIDEMLSTAEQLERFMAAPAFMAAFKDLPNSEHPDAEAITHIAHRTMDYHERFLELSEQCRALSTPSRWSDIVADCARLLDIPLQSYREFIADYVDIIEALPRVLGHATGDIHLGSLGLYIKIDARLQGRIYERLDAIYPS